VFWCARCVQLKMSAALLTSCSFFSAYTACVPSAGGVRRTEEGRTLRVRDARGLARAADAHALPRREEHGAHERGRDVEEATVRVSACTLRRSACGTHPSGTTIVVTMAELWVVGGGGEGGRRRSWLGATTAWNASFLSRRVPPDAALPSCAYPGPALTTPIGCKSAASP
jgi:hypothetical protein